MMSKEQTPSSFKIKMDFEPEESPCLDDFNEKRIKKSSPKNTLAPVLISCVIGALLLAGYMDLKGRISGLQNVGVQQSQNISETLESRFSALSIKHAALEEASAKNTQFFQSALAGIRDNLKKNQALLDQTAAAKADRKEIGQIQEDLKKSISDLKAAINSLATINAFNESQIAPISAQLSKLGDDLKASQAQIKEVEIAVAGLSKNQIDRKQVAAQVAAQVSASEKKMLEVVSQLRNTMDAAVKSLGKRIDNASVSNRLPPAAPALTHPDKKNAADSVPQPGEIVEENLP